MHYIPTALHNRTGNERLA